MKKLILLGSCLCAFSLFAFVIGQARYQAKNKAASSAVAPVKSIVAQQQAVGAGAIGTYAARGLPVALSAGSLNSEKRITELPCRLSLTGGSEISSINLVLFDLEPNGKLRAIEGWTQSFNGQPGGTDGKTGTRFFDFPLRLRGRLGTNSVSTLALESVSGPAGSWDIDFTELLQTVAAKAGGRPEAEAGVRQKPDRQSGDYGSNYCARAFALAAYLSKFSENPGLPSFSCDQQKRNFTVTYASASKAAQ